MAARSSSSRLVAQVTTAVQRSTRTPSVVLNRAASSSASASSSTSTSTFEPALPQGQSPAYDAALSFLSSHRTTTLAKIDALKSRLDPSNPDGELINRIDRLQVEAYANDPSVRRQFRETAGKGHFDRYIFRWLAEEQWKKEGGLDLLMQRVLQLNIVPDLLPELPPTSPLTLSPSGNSVEPGAYQSPSAFSSPPSLHFQSYNHPSLPTSSKPSPEALHTLLVIDPDAPSHETHSFIQRLHYLKKDIPLSVLSGQQDLFDSALGKEVLSWEPPAPEQGTKQHRYVFLLFRQPTSSSSSSSVESRENFNLRSYLSSNELSATDLVGVNLFRARWTIEEDEFINSVYIHHRGLDAAPVYGKVPKEVRYGYPLSAKRLKVEEARDAAWEKAVQEMQGLAEEVQGLAEQGDKVKA